MQLLTGGLCENKAELLIRATDDAMFSLVEKKYKIQVSDVMEKKLRLFGQARAHALLTDFPMIPLRESNGVALYEHAEENMYTMKGVVTIPTIAASDVMDLLHMPTTDAFRHTMHEIFGAVFLDGMVLHAAAPTALVPHESLSINWMALANASVDQVPHRDYVFLKYSQNIKKNSSTSRRPPAMDSTDHLFVCVWESLELDACPPLPESFHVNRLHFRRCGFIVQKFPMRNHVRVSFILSESHPVKTGVSHLTQNWLTRTLVCLSELPNALISHFLSRHDLFLDGDVAGPATAACVACPTPLTKQQRHLCSVCGKFFCPSCTSVRNVQQHGRTVHVRVCSRCATLKYRVHPPPPPTLAARTTRTSSSSSSSGHMLRAHSSPELMHNTDPLREKMKKLALSLVKAKGLRELGSSCAKKLLALAHHTDMTLVREAHNVQVYECTLDNVHTTKTVTRVPHTNLHALLRRLEMADCNALSHGMGHLFGALYMDSQVLHAVSPTDADAPDAWSINVVALDRDEALFLKYGTILNDHSQPVGVSVWENLPVREYEATATVVFHRCGFVVEECPTRTALRLSCFVSQVDNPHVRARSLLTKMAQAVDLLAFVAATESVDPCRHCQRTTELSTPIVAAAIKRDRADDVGLHDQAIDCLHAFRHECLVDDAAMTLVKEAKDIQLYERSGPDRFTVKAVVYLPRLVPLQDVVASLDWSTSAAMAFGLRQLFGSRFVDGVVLDSTADGVHRHYVVLQGAKPRLPHHDYVFLSYARVLSDTLGVVVWDSFASDDNILAPTSSCIAVAPVRRSFHRCGLAVEDQGGTIKVSFVLSDPEPRTRHYLLLLLSELSPASFSTLFMGHCLAHMPLVTTPTVDGPTCRLCAAAFSLVRPKFTCGFCAAPMCFGCSVRKPLVQHDAGKTRVALCRDCYQIPSSSMPRRHQRSSASLTRTGSSHSASSGDMFRDAAREIHVSRVHQFEALARQRVHDLTSLSATTMRQLRDVHGLQYYDHQDDDMYTMMSVVLIPKCSRRAVVEMLTMPTTDLVHHFLRALLGGLFLDGAVLFANNDTMTLNWLLLRHVGGLTSDYVFMKYLEHDNRRSVVLWTSVDVDKGLVWPIPNTNPTRRKFQRTGFVVEDTVGGDNAHVCRVSFVLSEVHLSVSTKTKAWMQQVLASISGIGKALIAYELSKRCVVLVPRVRDGTSCHVCTKSFSLVRKRTFCRICGHVVCHRCVDVKALLQQPRDVKVCHQCIARAIVAPDTKQPTVIWDLDEATERRASGTALSNVRKSHPSRASSSSASSGDRGATSSSVRLTTEQTNRMRMRGPVWMDDLVAETTRNMHLVRDPSKGAQLFERQDADAYVVKSVLILPKYNLVDVMELLEMPTLESFHLTMHDLFGGLFVDGSVLHAEPRTTHVPESLSLTWMVFLNSRTHLPLRDSIVAKYGAIVTQDANKTKKRMGVSAWESIPLDATPPMPPLANMVRVNITRSGFVVEELDQTLRLTFLLTEVHTGRRAISNYMKLWMHKMAMSISEIPNAVISKYLSQLTLLTHFLSSTGSVCAICAHSFSSLRRRFNCCVCGDEVCGKCSDVKRVRGKEVHACILCTAPSKLVLRRRNTAPDDFVDPIVVVS
ncbi:Aste57867_22194 [Aphanomyces stellatus]|uniref:Aste57867_22194 protein n=1 Tax=Aphanomyces stellatus TaxID=120398 RepID=A0A485LJQ6_9STRA|nr:hypothetical protein As57867_022125 [Aphanomyces stellatus]VFT98861.1 Aste57867_22194 [Aphanomyces stellatus]